MLEPDKDNEFVAVMIDEFANGKPIPYSIYIRLSNTKYLKIANAGDGLDEARVGLYREKSVKNFYLTRGDFGHYMGMAPASNPDSADPEVQEKIRFLKDTAEASLELMKINGISQFVYDTASDLVTSTVDVASDERTIVNLLTTMNLSPGKNTMYDHSLGTSVYSLMIARMLGWNTLPALFKISMAGLLHDVGTYSIEADVLAKPESQLTKHELFMVHQHPENGAETLAQLTNAPKDVVRIVSQHHENCAGTGYPKKMGAAHIDPMAKVVGLADRFCDLVLSAPGSERLQPNDALKKLATSGEFDPVAISALGRVLAGMVK